MPKSGIVKPGVHTPRPPSSARVKRSGSTLKPPISAGPKQEGPVLSNIVTSDGSPAQYPIIQERGFYSDVLDSENESRLLNKRNDELFGVIFYLPYQAWISFVLLMAKTKAYCRIYAGKFI